MSDLLSPKDIDDAGLADWRQLGATIRARYRTRDFATGLRLVEAVGAAAEAADHHPDVDLRYGHVDIALWSHDSGGVTNRDLALARTITQLAHDLGGLEADTGALAALYVALDTPDHERVKPFWRAVLGYDDHRRSSRLVEDRSGHLPPLWFQASGTEEPRQRFHLDVLVPADERQRRIEAALAAGGTVVDETPTFTVLADADGNRVCVCVS